MPTYAIGDVQGCFAELEKLLAHIQFNPRNDTLWFTGDIVNRGPRSLEVLRFIKSLGEKHITVLGNHDLHVIAVALGVHQINSMDTVQDILQAPDKNALITWLRHRPLLHAATMNVNQKNYVMTHAGLAPAWSLAEAKKLAQEVETVLRSEHPQYFLEHMYGNEPAQWHAQLTGADRLRCITNYFTRLRFCDEDGRMDFAYKGDIKNAPAALHPWFEIKNRINKNTNIIFGHWAALEGRATVPHIYPLDTGCVWGKCLTAMRLEDEKRFSVEFIRHPERSEGSP